MSPALYISPEEVGTAEFAMERQRHYRREHQAQVKRTADEAHAKMQAFLEADETRKKEKRDAYALRLLEMVLAKKQERQKKERAERDNGLSVAPPPSGDGPSIRDVVVLVAASFGVQVEEVLSRSRLGSSVPPRQVAMYICMKRLRRTSTQIANVFKRHHSTVLHARDKVASVVVNDPELRQRISEIEGMLS